MSNTEITALLTQILSRLSTIEENLNIPSGGGADSGTADDVPRSIKAFDKYLSEKLTPFHDACMKLGGDAAIAGNIVQGAWQETRAFLLMATACKEPAQSELPGLLGNLGAKLKEMSSAVNRNEWERHTKACSEGMACLNWVCIKPAPVDFIESSIGGSDYYANGIRKEFRTTNPDHIAFCDTFKALITGLMAYVKEFHTTGVAWNAKGGDCKDYNGSSVAASASASASAPKADAAAAPTTTKAASADASKAGLFSALNKGGAITSGLKTVTKDMQTWRAEFKGGDAPAPAAAKPKPAVAARAVAAMKAPPLCEYSEGGSKWRVEYQVGQCTVEIKDKKETVYIYGCVGGVIDVRGKCKSIIVDGCKKTTLNFDNAMASVEVVNCQRVQVTCREAVPAIAVDKTDGFVAFLPSSSLTTEIVASKSSEMNVQWNDENGELIERPIPEQYVHRIKGLSITADVSDLYGH